MGPQVSDRALFPFVRDAVRSGDHLGRFDEVALGSGRGLHSQPHLDRVEADRVREVLNLDLVTLAQLLHQVLEEEGRLLTALPTGKDDDHRDPEHQVEIAGALGERSGQLYNSGLVPEDLPRGRQWLIRL